MVLHEFLSILRAQAVDYSSSIAFVVGISVMGIPMMILLAWLVRKECFAFTHYPMRLNRKTRMLYAFRVDGSILQERWDDVFFTIAVGGGVFNYYDVRGHILDADGITVKESFSLGGASYGEPEQAKTLWEFFRRYMEDGPQQALGKLELVCLPRLDQQRESFIYGWKRLMLTAHGAPLLQLLMLPLHTLESLTRWFAMRTSKIPVWPQEIEDACAIDPADPLVRDISTNAADVRGT
jgi:hypothetical protein